MFAGGTCSAGSSTNTTASPRDQFRVSDPHGIGGKLVALEVFDAPETLTAQWNRLVEGAASAFLDHRRAVAAGAVSTAQHRYPDPGALGRMLQRTSAALATAVVSPSVGEGSDIRLMGVRVTGSALVRGDRVVHLELFRVEA